MPTSKDEGSGSLRASRYRQFADETLQRAQTSPIEEVRTAFLSLAACWKKLAENADRYATDETPSGKSRHQRPRR